MRNKKSFKADLEKRKILFFAVGCIIAFSLSWISLDLLATKPNVKPVFLDEPALAVQEEYLPPEVDKKVEEPLRQEIQKMASEMLFSIVKNNEVETFSSLFPVEYDPDLTVVDWDETEVVPEPIDDEIYTFVEVMPEFPGGMPALNDFLRSHLKYPAPAVEAGAQGTVLVEFVVEKDGSVSGSKVVVSAFPALDAEALRVVSSLPKWKPGAANGRPVRVYYNVPIHFSLSN